MRSPFVIPVILLALITLSHPVPAGVPFPPVPEWTIVIRHDEPGSPTYQVNGHGPGPGVPFPNIDDACSQADAVAAVFVWDSVVVRVDPQTGAVVETVSKATDGWIEGGARGAGNNPPPQGKEPITCITGAFIEPPPTPSQGQGVGGQCILPDGSTKECEVEHVSPNEKIVRCKVKNACDGKRVRAIANLKEGAPGSSVRVRVLCNGEPVPNHPAFDDNAADKKAVIKTGTKPESGNCVCEVRYLAPGAGAYSAEGICQDP